MKWIESEMIAEYRLYMTALLQGCFYGEDMTSPFDTLSFQKPLVFDCVFLRKGSLQASEPSSGISGDSLCSSYLTFDMYQIVLRLRVIFVQHPILA